MKYTLGRVVTEGSVAIVILAILFHWLGPDYHASTLGEEWGDAVLEVFAVLALFMGAVRYVRGPEAASRVAARVLLLGTTIVLLASVGEVATRVLFKNVTSSADYRSFFNRRWTTSGAISYNHLGFREREFSIEKAPGMYRIAVIGDSFTWGSGLRAEERLTDLLQTDCAHRGCEVLNFGIPGSDTPDNTNTLEKVVLPLHPDFVLLAWFTNDPEEVTPPDRPPIFLPLLPWPGIELDLFGRSALFSILKIRWSDLQLLFWKGDPYVDYMRKRFGDSGSPDAREADAQLRKFIGVCRTHDVDVGIILWPHLALDLGPNYPLDFLHQHVLSTCKDEGVRCVDLRPELSRERDRRKLHSSLLDTHPSLVANRIAETQVLSTFGPIWFGDHPHRP